MLNHFQQLPAPGIKDGSSFVSSLLVPSNLVRCYIDIVYIVSCIFYQLSLMWVTWLIEINLAIVSYTFFHHRYPSQYYFWKMRIWFGTQEDPILYHSSSYSYLVLRSLYTTFDWSKMRYTSARNILFLSHVVYFYFLRINFVSFFDLWWFLYSS